MVAMTSRTKDGFIWTSNHSGRPGLTTEALVTSTPALKEHYDVIVIGAGFAGLTAARDLTASRELSVLLVEARDRVGGRTFTVKELGEEFEIGGQWVHWWQPNVYRELVRYGLEGNLQAAQVNAEDVLGMQENEIETALADFFTINGLTARQLMPWPMDVYREPAPWKWYDHLSIKDRLDSMTSINMEARDLIEMNYTANSGTDAANAAFSGALRWYALGGYTFAGTTAVSGTYKIGDGGMTSLANAMARELNCDRSFGTEVTAITQDDEGVTLQTKDGNTLTAGRMVCTIPLNVLSTISFQPPLPILQQEAVDKGMPHKGGKIICQLDGKHHCDIAGTLCGQSPFMFSMADNYDSTGSDTTALAFTWPNAFSTPYDLRDYETVLPALNNLLEHKAPVNAYIVHDWATDPYARGAWMSFRPGDMSMYAEALQQSHGRIVMASADWAHGFAGFVDGAIEQGAKAAVRVKVKLAKPDRGAPLNGTHPKATTSRDCV